MLRSMKLTMGAGEILRSKTGRYLIWKDGKVKSQILDSKVSAGRGSLEDWADEIHSTAEIHHAGSKDRGQGK